MKRTDWKKAGATGVVSFLSWAVVEKVWSKKVKIWQRIINHRFYDFFWFLDLLLTRPINWLIVENDRNIYKHKTKDNWIFVCQAKINGLDCAYDSTFQKYSYGKNTHLINWETKVEFNFHFLSFSLGSGSKTDEPWQAKTYKLHDGSNKKAVISCECTVVGLSTEYWPGPFNYFQKN